MSISVARHLEAGPFFETCNGEMLSLARFLGITSEVGTGNKDYVWIESWLSSRCRRELTQVTLTIIAAGQSDRRMNCHHKHVFTIRAADRHSIFFEFAKRFQQIRHNLPDVELWCTVKLISGDGWIKHCDVLRWEEPPLAQIKQHTGTYAAGNPVGIGDENYIPIQSWLSTHYRSDTNKVMLTILAKEQTVYQGYRFTHRVACDHKYVLTMRATNRRVVFAEFEKRFNQTRHNWPVTLSGTVKLVNNHVTCFPWIKRDRALKWEAPALVEVKQAEIKQKEESDLVAHPNDSAIAPADSVRPTIEKRIQYLSANTLPPLAEMKQKEESDLVANPNDSATAPLLTNL